ncbi:hypothetical protein Ancab_024587 [Ancistrocladus abbreviatus]
MHAPMWLSEKGSNLFLHHAKSALHHLSYISFFLCSKRLLPGAPRTNRRIGILEGPLEDMKQPVVAQHRQKSSEFKFKVYVQLREHAILEDEEVLSRFLCIWNYLF